MKKLPSKGVGAPDYYGALFQAPIPTYSIIQIPIFRTAEFLCLGVGEDTSVYSISLRYGVSEDYEREIVKKIEITMSATELLDVVVKVIGKDYESVVSRRFGYGKVEMSFSGGILVKQGEELEILIANRDTENHRVSVTIQSVGEK